MARYLCGFCAFLRTRIYLITWISLVIYLFYKSFTFYLNGRQFYYLRRMLGLGLCISRGTATVLNLCCALVLLPLCKKLNQLLYRVMSKLCPGLFFLWLEKAKSFHMSVAITLLLFGVIHSISHFVNLYNFSRGYDEQRSEINMARYRNESPLKLLMSVAGVTGVSMLVIILSMGVTSSRAVRRRVYNAFWYTHQLYLPFMVLLMVHPLSGVLKEEILNEGDNYIYKTNTTIISTPKFAAIKSVTWLWMIFPLSCFLIDMFWRVFTRNLSRVQIVNVNHMAGRTISLTLSSQQTLQCRSGQYILLQCHDISLVEWHPFTVVQVPTKHQREFVVWIKVKGDWTEALEGLLKDKGSHNVNVCVDGPFPSPLQRAAQGHVSLLVSAGVGVTPFVTLLYDMYLNPRSTLPGRIHLIWIVRTERELTWIAELANNIILKLRDANRPDRLHLELYVTSNNNIPKKSHMIIINENGNISNVLDKNDEKETLLTPHMKRNGCVNTKLMINDNDNDFDISKKYPLVGCRVRRGRPHWDKVFGYWVHLYPGHHLNLYCCGPKKLVKLLRNKSCKLIKKMSFLRTLTDQVYRSDLFDFNLKYLYYVGLWPENDWPKRKLVLYKIYEYALHVMAMCFIIMTGIGTYQNRHDLITMMSNLDKSLVAYNFFSKTVFFITKRNKLKILINEIKNSGDEVSEYRKKLMAIHVIVITFISTALVTTFFFLSQYEFEMTVEAWMPFDPLKDRRSLLLSSQILATCFIPCMYRAFALQGIVCSIVMYFCDQLIELQQRLRAMSNAEEGISAREEFKAIVKKHVRLMRYSKTFTNIFKEFFLIQNLAVTIELCFNALMVTIAGFEEKTLLASFLTFLGLALVNAYIFCYLGDELIVQSTGIAQAAYESGWTAWPLDMQKDLLIVIRVAQRPFALSAGGISVMCIQTYSEALYNAYSIFAVLNDVVD